MSFNKHCNYSLVAIITEEVVELFMWDGEQSIRGID